MKRVLDIVLILVSAWLWLPLLLVTGLLVLLFSGRPVFFIQERPGLKGKPFKLIKFRTMLAGDASDEERLTRFGSCLRSLSLDELPELVNVLRGEMSLVGPRPLLMRYLPLYSERQMRRHDVLPGLTGWAQVNGRNALSWEQKFELDVWYVENRTVLLDLRILAVTVWKVLKREGIAGENSASMGEFLLRPRSGRNGEGKREAGYCDDTVVAMARVKGGGGLLRRHSRRNGEGKREAGRG